MAHTSVYELDILTKGTEYVSDLYRRYQFFKDAAGYVVGKRAVGALELARAEVWAEEQDVDFRWEWDNDGDLGDHEYWCSNARHDAHLFPHTSYRYPVTTCDHEIYWCAAWQPCAACADGDTCDHEEVVASLGSIIDPSREYRRVIEAELAWEAMAQAS